MWAERFRVENGANEYDLVQLHRLTKTYHLIHKKIIAVNNISVGIPAGEVRKSVLFLAILCIDMVKWQKSLSFLNFFLEIWKSASEYFDGFYICNLHASMCYLPCKSSFWQGGLTTQQILSPRPSYYPPWVDFQSRSPCRVLFSTLSFQASSKDSIKKSVVGSEVLELHSHSHSCCFHRSNSKAALKGGEECGHFPFCRAWLQIKCIRFILPHKEIIASVVYSVKLWFCVNNLKSINIITSSGLHIWLGYPIMSHRDVL